MSDEQKANRDFLDRVARVVKGEREPAADPASDLDVRIDEYGRAQLGNPALRAHLKGGDETYDAHGIKCTNPVRDARSGVIRFEGDSIVTSSAAENRATAAARRNGSLDGCDLRELPFSRKCLVGAKLNDADCTGASFEGTALNEANLGGTTFDSARMGGANLYLASAQKASFRGADLRNANFKNADLREADFSGAVLDGADLRGADLRGVDLTKAKSLKGAQLQGARTESREYLDKKYPRS